MFAFALWKPATSSLLAVQNRQKHSLPATIRCVNVRRRLSSEMGLTFASLAAAFLLQTLQATAESFLSCDPTVLRPCPGDEQICDGSTKRCICKDGLTPVGDECVAPSESSHGGTIAVAVIFTLALLIGGLVLVVRKYNLIEYVRQKINLRRGNDVMYEDVMIGQDDPPLSP